MKPEPRNKGKLDLTNNTHHPKTDEGAEVVAPEEVTVSTTAAPRREGY